MYQNNEEAAIYLAAIIMSSDDAIISKDLNGNITSWNPAAERIFGYTEAEAVGKHITMIIPSDRLQEEEKILTTLKSGNRVDHYETLRRHKKGNLIPISLTVSPIRDKRGVIIGASKISRDISQRIEAEQAIKEMSLKKDEFLANMSHELRTPMNAVIGLANLLQRSNLSDRDKKLVETLKISADNLMDLINDLLDFAKLESGSVILEQVKFDLVEQMQKLVSIMNVKAREKNLILNIEYAPGLNRYYIGDPLRINQIVTNLVSNAIKFTISGKVDIKIDGEADETNNATKLIISVRDTGIGIAADKLDVIFEKFAQADASMTRRFGGSGLGLAISKTLAENMGGGITVASDMGIGSTFTVTLVLKNSEDIAAVQMPAQSKNQAIELHKNVLLVEDYAPNVLVASEMLENMGYNYDVADNGIAAVKKFMVGKYDAILMDVQMHDLDGLQATKRIREFEKERNLPHTPIIAMTAHVRDQDKERCYHFGMDDFIPKPFNPIDLESKLARYIKTQDNK